MRRRSCRRIRATAGLLALAAGLSGCVPAPQGTYLRPSYPDSSAVLTRADCGGRLGPPRNLSFTAPGEVKFMVSARRDESEPAGGWLLSVHVEPEAGSGFRFISDTVEVASAPSAAGERTRPKVLVTSTQHLPANAWIDIGRLGPTSQDIATRAQAAEGGLELAAARTSGTGSGNAPQRLRVTLPALQTPRERFATPPLDLAADAGASGVQTLRSADYAQTLAQREARCRAQTPQAACESIGALDRYSFRHEAGPFTYLGRFWNVAGDQPQPLRFELEVHARTAEPWRIAEPIVRVQEEEGADAAQPRPLDQISVTLRYPAPLDARLRGAAAAMLIELALPASRSRHFVQLPYYEANGLRHRLQPIELEQRRFESRKERADCG